MRSITLAAVAAAGIALGAVQSASAADIPRPVYKAAPVIVAYNWSGFYIGGNFGYGSGDLNATAWGFGASASIDGWFGGGQIGWNWQAPGSPWVWGVEVDSQWANIGNDVTVTGFNNGNAIATAFTDLDYFGTARLRLGYAWDRAMLYGTGGLAWGSNSIGTNFAVNGLAAGVDSSNTHVGWTVGGGLEWALLDNWTAKVEYLYVKLDNENYFANNFNGLGFDADLDVHTIKLGFNYRFGYSKAPVVAKY
jgi:outer membrane immunogenic protein